ncbi:helicase domino isoform X1 [Athalia rosae]|uniref:helicase domino isoform X1 n=1 Tax=Athalia rosae TaxID=37344 RepID=UPI0020337F33|nr:helicase domino isoform X1 [Athalia rosae]XP_020707839.2 helicase domino isoform X1 [Athalia rosae]
MSDKQAAPSLPPLVGGGGNNGGATQQTVRLQQVLTTAQGLNVLTTGSGQQFVITSQVPGLAQVIPGSITTNAGIQQVGVTRIVNISGNSPRVSVVSVAGASNSPLPSPTRQSPAKVVLSTSPKQIRTALGNVFVTPSAQTAIQSPPARKRLRLSESTEKITTIDDSLGYRRRIMDHKMKRMRAIREKYAENASELFFLHVGGNMMDFQNWRKRPTTPQYLHFLRQHRLDPEDDDEDLTVPSPAISDVSTTSASLTTTITVAPSSLGTEVKIPGAGVTPVAVSTTLPAAVAQLSQQGGTPILPDPPKPLSVTVSSPVAERIPAASTSTKPAKPPPNLVASQPVVKLVKLPSSTVVSSSDAANNQEQIVEKAKQEAYVMQRISELQREGLWSERRLPKVQEPSRTKAHWDYLLEEMVWLAADFAQERKWKKAAAKKCARMVQKHFQEKAVQAQKAEKSHELRLKKIASFVAKEIKTFWTNVEKLVEYKQQTRLEEKRKKALDQHLNFIVGQTEKYSTWLTEGLNKTDSVPSVSASMNSSRISSPVASGKHHSDDEFEPNQSSDDDEETIAKAEEEMRSTTNHVEEVELLKRESELPLEDLLKELPPNYLEERDRSLSPELDESVDNHGADRDEEFVAASDESSDDEDTIMEQEKLELNQDHKQELNDLKAENEMSIDDLMAKYGHLPDMAMDVDEETDKESCKDSVKDEDDDKENEDSEIESESEDETKDEDSQTQSDDETNVGLKSLLEDLTVEKSPTDKSAIESENQSDQARNEMDDVAALAESIQPKGNTLLTTSVVTKIPFLLKHSLREYQHIGLDWLVTMFERKLNGILADEMGLGKTIQTIALLAHLACEKGNWGPHLIIVPTSVMLNWEMECKKWCPGFKILTYYGTQKERKQKRTGWTKPNAFHICITSYKLVIQDHQSFRRKKWKYLILDEAQNIKNFKSQRWQLLLNFQTQRRLLLTGTPLQNNLMELWSLMHFLMPNVFQSHREFKEWFSNPVTGMIEGNSEYNENIIRRLHKVLRPFLLRRLKTEVEKQLPKKYEHVVMCRLSKRQRYLYDDFMSRAKTRETLASGNLLSVINVLMQLRKVCNHPNLFEVRPTVSPFQMEGIDFVTASLAWSALDYNPFEHIDLSCLNLILVDLELTLTAFVAHRVKQFKTPRKLIEEIDSQPDPPPKCPAGKIKINVRLSNQSKASPPPQPSAKLKNVTGIVPSPKAGTSPLIKGLNNQAPSGQAVTLRVANRQHLQGYSVQLVQHQGSVKAIPVATLAHTPQTTTVSTPTTATMNPQRITVGSPNMKEGLQRLTTQTVTVKQGDSVQRIAVPSFAQLVQTSSGRHIILTSNQQNTNTVSFPVMTSVGKCLTVLSKSLMGLTTSVTTVNKVMPGVVTTTTPATSGRPIMRVPPLNVTTSLPQATPGTQQLHQQQLRYGIVTRNSQNAADKAQVKELPKSEFYLPQLEEERRQRRQAKLQTIANLNDRRCAACPLYGEDLFDALRIAKPVKNCCWHGEGWLQCKSAHQKTRTRREYFSSTEALAEAIKSTELIVEQLQEVFERFVVYVPAVQAPTPKFHVSHPPPHKLWAQQRLQIELQHELSPKFTLFHPVSSAMSTQFPDPRLIQYDCGKLQALDRLLRQLKTGNHRVLIFTQMTRMLDVLEAFLNFHGHIYLRLDGATKVDQRQVLMERFNGDKRIFCFILSTRSGGVGVNLTGADTVIFYDSDWNPTMDAQAQDRCHRIGQTRDVHIYRLVSEKTVEENILKKANQKRLLGDLAIEGGNFTTAYFKSSTIQDLFNVDQAENDASTRMAEVLDRSRDREKIMHKDHPSAAIQPPTQPLEEKAAMGALENALAAAEEDLDVQAARTAKAEAVADLAEFDENIPLDDVEKEDTQVSKAEQEVQHLVQQLSPIERYAMKFVEESEGSFSAAQLAAAERELEQQKKEWELDRLRALREEEERRMRLADDDEKPLTFGREDAQNQVNNTSNSKKLVNKKTPPSRRSTRTSSHSVRESSESETETTTSESESQEDQVEDSPDEESSHTESQSQEDDDEEENDDEEDRGRQNNSKSSSPSKNRNKSNRSTDKSQWDLNSPRTRSRGDVKINLWTLDVRPILPGLRPVNAPSSGGSRKKRVKPKSDEMFMPPPRPDTVPKKIVNTPSSPIHSNLETRGKTNQDKKFGNCETPLDEALLTKVNDSTGSSNVKKISPKTNPVEATLIFDIKSNSLSENTCSTNENVVSTRTDVDIVSELDEDNVKSSLDPIVEIQRVDAVLPSIVPSDSVVNDVGETIESESGFISADSRDTDTVSSVTTKVCASDLNTSLSRSNAEEYTETSDEPNSHVDSEFKEAQNSKLATPVKNCSSSPNEFKLNRHEDELPISKSGAPLPIGTEIVGTNSDSETDNSTQSNKVTETLDSDADSSAIQTVKSKTRSSRPITSVQNFRSFSPAPVTRSRCLPRTGIDLIKPSEAKSRSSSPAVSDKKAISDLSSQKSTLTSPMPVTRSANKSAIDSCKIPNSVGREADDIKPLNELHQVSDRDSQIDKFAISGSLPTSPKPNINSVPKSRGVRPDTPFPGVTTRNKRLTLIGNSNIPCPPLNESIQSPNTLTPPTSIKRVTRSGASQSSDSNINTNSQTSKFVLKLGRLQRPDTPFPVVSDFSRVTRSGISRPITPLPQKSQKLARGTSLQTSKLPNDPTSSTDQTNQSTKLIPCANSSSKSIASSSREPSRFSTRSTIQKSDGDFQVPSPVTRKSRSVPSTKPISDTNAMPSPLSTRSTRRLSANLNVEGKFLARQRRPDTPLPISVRSSRVTRSTSNLDSVPQIGGYTPQNFSRVRTASKSSIGTGVTDDTIVDHSSNISSLQSAEIMDTILNSEPSSSTQTVRSLSPRLKAKLSRKFSITPATKEVSPLDSRISNTDSNANAVDSPLKIEYPNSNSSLTESQTSSKVLKKSIPSTVKPDSTTKILEHITLNSQTDTNHDSYFTSSKREISELTDNGASNITELSRKNRAQLGSKFKLSIKSSSSRPNQVDSNLSTDESQHPNARNCEPPVLQNLNTYSNSYTPKSFVRVGKIENSRVSGSEISIKSTMLQSSDSNPNNSSDKFLRGDETSVDSKRVDRCKNVPRRADPDCDKPVQDSSPRNDERQSLAPPDSTVVTYIDLDTEPEYRPPPKKYRNKKRRTRVGSLTKPTITDKPGNIEIVEIIEDVDRSQARFTKKAAHLKSSASSEKSNNGPVS